MIRRVPSSVLTRRPIVVLVTDVALVLLFAGIGRAEHDRGNPVLGVVETAWPFLLGLAVGWVAIGLASRRCPVRLIDGVPVWLATVLVGMLARQLSGDGTALSFVVVAILVLGVFLLGSRALHAVFTRRRRSAA